MYGTGLKLASHTPNLNDTSVWVKRDAKHEVYVHRQSSKIEVIVVKETVIDKYFDKRFLPPLPPIPVLDPCLSNHYDTINEDLLEATDQPEQYAEPAAASPITNLPQQEALHTTVITRKTQQVRLDRCRIPELPSSASFYLSHEVSECQGYEEMVDIFQPLIVKNLIVREILPYLPFIEDHEDLYAAEKRSPREAVTCLLNELKSCKEVGKWHKFLEALRLCGYEYIVQNISGYRFVNHHYQEEYLKKLAPKLSKVIKARQLLPHLFAEDLISQMDREEIEREDDNKGNIASAMMLLNRIPRKRAKWYITFISVLRDEGFTDVAEDLDIPNLTSYKKIKVQQTSTMQQTRRKDNPRRPPPFRPRKAVRTLGSEAKANVLDLSAITRLSNNSENSTPRHDNLLKLDSVPTEVFTPPLPPRGVPFLLNPSLSYLFYQTPSVTSKDQNVKLNDKPVARGNILGNDYYETDCALRPPVIESDNNRDFYDNTYFGDFYDDTEMPNAIQSTSAVPENRLKPSPNIPEHIEFTDETCEYETYDECAPAMTESGNSRFISDDTHPSESGTANSTTVTEIQQETSEDRSEYCLNQDETFETETYEDIEDTLYEDTPSGVLQGCTHTETVTKHDGALKFQHLETEINDLQTEMADLETENNYLQKKNDLRGHLIDKLRKRRELLQSISIKEKEATALKTPLDTAPENKDYEDECPESARIFWSAGSGLFAMKEKTTLHFSSDCKMETVRNCNAPVKIYDPNLLYAGRNSKFVNNDSAIDCTY